MNFEFKKSSCYLISLLHRDDRRDQFVHNTNTLGFEIDTFEWVNAILDADYGALGCAKSHVLALTKFLTETENDYCCIFEDDFNFRESKAVCEEIISRTLTDFRDCSVFLLAGTFLTPMPTDSSQNGFHVNKVFEANSTSGYIVKRNYIRTLIDTFIESIQGLEMYRTATPRKVIQDKFAIDQTWKRLQRQDNWYCTVPMLGAQIASYSDIEKVDINYSNYSS